MIKKNLLLFLFIAGITTITFAQNDQTSVTVDQDGNTNSNIDYAIGGIFGATTINGENYQQIGLRPELKLWKLGIGLDLHILLDEDGKVREED